MFTARNGEDPRWNYGLFGDFSGISAKYRARKILERKDARIFQRYRERVEREQALAAIQDMTDRLESIKTDLNTEKDAPPARLTMGQRLYAWWCGHAF